MCVENVKELCDMKHVVKYSDQDHQDFQTSVHAWEIKRKEVNEEQNMGLINIIKMRVCWDVAPCSLAGVDHSRKTTSQKNLIFILGDVRTSNLTQK
jgi:hypothetical protein